MQDNDGALWLIVLVVAGFSIFAAYKMGRHLERKELSKFFVEMTERTFWDGCNACRS